MLIIAGALRTIKKKVLIWLNKPLNSPSGRRSRKPPEPLRSCTAPPSTLSPGFLAASPPGSRCSPAATSAGLRWHRPSPQTLKPVREARVRFGSGSEVSEVTKVFDLTGRTCGGGGGHQNPRGGAAAPRQHVSSQLNSPPMTRFKRGSVRLGPAHPPPRPACTLIRSIIRCCHQNGRKGDGSSAPSPNPGPVIQCSRVPLFYGKMSSSSLQNHRCLTKYGNVRA